MTDEPANRPLAEQFADLPEGIQSRLFRILDVVIGMSHEEKDQAQRWFLAAEKHETIVEPVRKAARALGLFVFYADQVAKGSKKVTRP